jgi:DUF971 family protein
VSTPAVLDITVVRDRGLVLEYEDGAVCEFPLAELRAACPCAGCRAVRERGGTPGPAPERAGALRIEDAELTGAWGISITWNDGHATGIYPWDSLRRWYDGDTDGVVVQD